MGERKFGNREPLPASSLRLDRILRVGQRGLSMQRETGTVRPVSVLGVSAEQENCEL